MCSHSALSFANSCKQAFLAGQSAEILAGASAFDIKRPEKKALDSLRRQAFVGGFFTMAEITRGLIV
jgi:hypothetical protein